MANARPVRCAYRQAAASDHRQSPDPVRRRETTNRSFIEPLTSICVASFRNTASSRRFCNLYVSHVPMLSSAIVVRASWTGGPFGPPYRRRSALNGSRPYIAKRKCCRRRTRLKSGGAPLYCNSSSKGSTTCTTLNKQSDAGTAFPSHQLLLCCSTRGYNHTLRHQIHPRHGPASLHILRNGHGHNPDNLLCIVWHLIAVLPHASSV